jgi:hypothetical protein
MMTTNLFSLRLNLFSIIALLILASVPALVAAPRAQMSKPDFTRGDSIPEGATHDWTLGATGARGWIYSNNLETSEARQIYITEVNPQSPADGILEKGDVILGVAGKSFSYDPRIEFAKALTIAETESGAGQLKLQRWRAGTLADVIVELPVLGSYSATAPFNCQKSKKIFEDGCKALAERMVEPGYKQNPITRSLNALALLASGEEKYHSLLKREAEWASNYSADSFQTWWYGYVISFLAEYTMATGDQSVMPGLERLAMEAANGQSIVGSWGHKFAGEDGRLLGYGMMNAPGLPLTISLDLARRAGVKNPQLDLAIERSAKLLRFYIGKGSVPYGDHHPWIQTHDDNGKNGMAAVLFNLLKEPKGAKYFSRMSLASHGAERDYGHTGNFWNMTWAMPGVAQSGPHATGAWMQEFGSWYYDLARGWDGSFRHQGPPEMKPDKTGKWDATGAYLIAYAMPLKNLYLTGKHKSIAPQLNAEEANTLIDDGRGWTRNNRHSTYDALGSKELLHRLGSWSPVVRERAAIALARLKDKPLPEIIRLLDSPDLYTRLGACQALEKMKKSAAPAVPELIDLLDADDLWLRVKAADALVAIGEPALVAVPKLLEKLALGPTENDPRGMEQRYLIFALFNKRGGLLGRSLDGVDREQLYTAVRAGLQNQDGRARGSFTSVYQSLSFEEIKPLLPAIHQAIVDPAPSGIMFADGIRLAGLQLLAKHRIAEGMPLCIDIMEIERWGKRNRINQCLKSLASYKGAAKPLLPELRELEKALQAHGEAKGLKPQIDQLQALIKSIEKADSGPELRSIRFKK